MKLSLEEIQRLKVYGGISPSPLGKDVPGSNSSRYPRPDSGYGEVALGTGKSSAVQALYACISVKRAFVSLWYRDQPLPDSDDDDDDDD